MCYSIQLTHIDLNHTFSKRNLALKVATQSPRNLFNHVIFIIGVTTAQGKKGFCKLGIVEAVFGRDILALVQYAYYANVFIMSIVIA